MSAAGATPGMADMTPSSTRSTVPGNSPSAMHRRASIACGASITRGDSRAASASGLRGSARNVIPNALTKQAAASASVSASIAAR